MKNIMERDPLCCSRCSPEDTPMKEKRERVRDRKNVNYVQD